MKSIKTAAMVMACVALTVLMLSVSSFAEDKVSPETIVGATTIDATKAKELFDKRVAFIDTRKDSDWNAGRIPGAIHLELKSVFTEKTLAEHVKNKDDIVVFYCNGINCMRSSEASEMAVKWGYTKVNYFRLGYPAWQAENYPTE